MIAVVSYANEKVTEISLRQLYLTAQTGNIHVWDNHYPLNRHDFVLNLCKELGFDYHSEGENVGMYRAFNELITFTNQDIILFDGDCYPSQIGWDKAILEVLMDKNVGTVTLSNRVNVREMNERGYDPLTINGHKVNRPHSACTNTVCGFNIDFLHEIGGLQGTHKYYGGNEILMWPHYSRKSWVYLNDFWEATEAMKPLHDWQYEQYKLLYAHRGLGMSFEDYLKTNPEKQDIRI